MHPFSWLPHSSRWYVLAVLFLAAATLAWKLSSQGKPLITPAAPKGMLSFQFCWSRSEAIKILDSWAKLKDVARKQLLWDYLFLSIYPLLLSLACVMLGDSFGDARAVVAVLGSWCVLFAGPLDAMENYALLRMLDSDASESMAKAAWWCAGIKFVLAFSALGYIAVAGIMNLCTKN